MSDNEIHGEQLQNATQKKRISGLSKDFESKKVLPLNICAEGIVFVLRGLITSFCYDFLSVQFLQTKEIEMGLAGKG